MARFKDHKKALLLRKQGKSYSQIKKILNISKSTLSCWLRDFPLSKQKIRELRDWNEQRIERCRQTKKDKKEKRLKEFSEQQEKMIMPLNQSREIYLNGLFLYWGEGRKNQMTSLSVSNTDPAVIKFFVYWLEKSLGVPKNKLKIHLHLYSDMDIVKETNYWLKILDIPINQFNKPYIKQTLKTNINHKGGFGHGTCNVRVNDARLAEKTIISLKLVSEYYLNKKV